jgi:hypothetical protein
VPNIWLIASLISSNEYQFFFVVWLRLQESTHSHKVQSFLGLKKIGAPAGDFNALI